MKSWPDVKLIPQTNKQTNTASTPPCRILLFIFIVLVWPIEVRILAVRFRLSLSVRSHITPLHPCLSIVYIIASSHALSYAFATSRKVIYVGGAPW